MDDITKLFISIIEEAPGVDIAESEFRKMLIDDPELRRQYKEYCREQGTSERNGFVEFCEEFYADRNSIWESLSDYDNEE